MSFDIYEEKLETANFFLSYRIECGGDCGVPDNHQLVSRVSFVEGEECIMQYYFWRDNIVPKTAKTHLPTVHPAEL